MQPLLTTLPEFLLIFSERGKKYQLYFPRMVCLSRATLVIFKILLERFLLKEERVNAWPLVGDEPFAIGERNEDFLVGQYKGCSYVPFLKEAY